MKRNYKHFLQDLLDYQVFSQALHHEALYEELSSYTDEQLIKVIQKESSNSSHPTNTVALCMLCQRYRPLIYKYALSRPTETEYEDMESFLWLTFIDAVKSFHLEGSVPFAGYAQSRIKYGQYNSFRKYRRQWQQEVSAEAFERDPNGDTEIPQPEYVSTADTALEAITNYEIDRLQRAIQCLTPTQQKLLHAIYYEGRTITDIGKERGITKQAVSKHYRRTLAVLRDIYERLE